MTGRWVSLRTGAAWVRRRSPRAFRLLREWHRRAIARRYHGDLVALAEYYGTDKWNDHWYAEIYAEHFRAVRDRPLNVLEIGVGGFDNPASGGASLRMWKAYFTKGQIHGIDIHDKKAVEERRIRVWQGSQVDSEFMSAVFAAIGRVDILIDDGSHMNAHVIATFQQCFPLLADDGLYAVEDVQTSYWPEYGGHARAHDDPGTTMGFFKQLTDGLNRSEMPEGARAPGRFDGSVRAVHFYHNLIVIEKGDGTHPRRRAR